MCRAFENGHASMLGDVAEAGAMTGAARPDDRVGPPPSPAANFRRSPTVSLAGSFPAVGIAANGLNDVGSVALALQTLCG